MSKNKRSKNPPPQPQEKVMTTPDQNQNDSAPEQSTPVEQQQPEQTSEVQTGQATEQVNEQPQQPEETQEPETTEAPQAAAETPTPEIKVVTPVAQPTTAVATPLPTPKAESGDFVNRIENLKNIGTSDQRSVISRLEKYVKEMAPGIPKTPEQIVAAQRGLWFAITSTLQKEPKEFNACFTIILDFFKAYENEAFGDRFVYRGAEHLPYDKQELAAFHQMVNLLKITCESKSRKHALQQVNLERTLADHFDEGARQKIIAYYQA